MTKKILIVCAVLLLATGCGVKALKSNYSKMQVGDKGISGYLIDLRVYSDNREDSKILRINNSKGDYEITTINTSINRDRTKTTTTTENPSILDDREVTYVKDGTVYTAGEDGKYKADKTDVAFTNPTVYLEGLKNMSSLDKGTKTKIGENEYTLYKVKFTKKVVQKILEDTNLKDVKVSGNVEGEIYIDKDGYVYRMVYSLETLTINATYFSIDNPKNIYFPSEIK